METGNSQCARLVVDTFVELFADLVRKYPERRKSLERDVQTLRQRVSSEGLSFVTKTLPRLGKAFDRSLGGQPLLVPSEFRRAHGEPAIPAFLQALLRGCYRPDGSLDRIEPSVVKDVRQVLFLAYKLELPYTRKQEEAVINSFIATEEELSGCELSAYDPCINEASRLVQSVFQGFDPKEIAPRHGPGAVASGECLDGKWQFSRLYNDIHQKYPYYDYFIAGGARELSDRIEWYRGLTRLEGGTAKVVLVPKDSRGPRLISAEPLEYQWIQQGLGRAIVRRLEEHSLSSGQVNFANQQVNRRLALESSETGVWCTIDLKDASDRVSDVLVRLLFPSDLYLHLISARTRSTVLPNGKVQSMCKFAPMGSALCFPVEATCFWALASAAVSRRGLSIQEAARNVFVYGDDIIVRTEHFDCVVETLESVGLRVNRDKCFRSGSFRESCGMDAFMGVDVTPVKLKTLWSGRPTDSAAFVSWIAYANLLRLRGYEAMFNLLRNRIESCYGLVPHGTSRSSSPCWVEASWFRALLLNISRGFRIRFSERLHRVEIFTREVRPRKKDTLLDGWTRLLRNQAFPDLFDPTVVVLPRSTQIRLRWMPLS